MAKKNIFLIGPMGAGKSTVGRYLSSQLDMDFYDSDIEIEKQTGADINWVFDIEGEDKFRKREELIISQLTTRKGIILSTGGGVILSKQNRNQLSARGLVIYLTINIENQIIRTKKEKNRPLLNSHIELEKVLQSLSTIRTPLYEEIADITVSTDFVNPKIIVQNIINMIKKYI
ncbi:shikimate kinase AroK [Buchnera aphidicola (Thelaxes californica)]|uniref:Shikimate kinase 1 n=1 Tax=Buchnera aphidicola (Thelaxes californica) TaxID=1315998 RepID=A0A4D6YC64_9GAMM|nr:shikimate kinase AroK [Buchnera aphidicola]QCI26939.1 shikimate kinase AroK [Buchnera aphidicola (Thelaxes californica)]